MSIDKESNGLPSVNVHRPTTIVNLWMVAAIVLFFGVAGVAAWWISRRAAAPEGEPTKAADAVGRKVGFHPMAEFRPFVQDDIRPAAGPDWIRVDAAGRQTGSSL